MKLHSVIIALAAMAPLSCGAATISDILQQISANNPELRSTAMANAARIAEMRSENTLPATSVEYSPFFRGGEKGVASSELVVSQEFDFPTLYATRSKQASIEEKALEASLTLRQRQLLAEARASLLQLILLRQEREILDARLADTMALLSAYERGLTLGSATILEVNKVKLECQDLQRDILQNEASCIGISDALAALNGNRELDLDALDYDLPAEALPLPTDPSALVERDAALAAADADTEAARHATSVARSCWLPGLTLGYRRNTEGKEASNGFMVGAALPLFTNSSRTKAAAARLNAATMQAETARAEAEGRLKADIRRMELEKATLATYDLSLMEETLQLYRKSLDAGQITLTDYYTETSQLYERLLSRARLENAVQLSYARLHSLLL